MADQFKEVDLAFRKYAGMDMSTAFRAIMEKNITPNEMSDLASKLFRSIIEDVKKKDLDDNYKILLHLVLSYYIFTTALKACDDWIKEAAAEHNMKPEKYIKIMFSI
jgi:hypothetical protein